MYTIFLILLFILGACSGSFLCCQARRLHLGSTKRRVKNRRSVCLHCHAQLRWYDNLPILSWLILKGKCRHCHKPIGIAELLSEFLVATAFLLIGTTINIFSASPMEWGIFIFTLVLTAFLAFLAIYDGLYGELPTLFLYLTTAFSLIIVSFKITLVISTVGFSPAIVIRPLLAVIILSGLYLFLYKVSKGKWVGDGDWLLCIPLALVLADPFLALVLLFIANFLACLVMLPVVRKTHNHRIHFGPFLVIAFVITLGIAKFIAPLLCI